MLRGPLSGLRRVLLFHSVSRLTACLALCLGAPAGLAGQTAAPEPAWTLRTRLFVSGDSYGSRPAGYKVYSGIGIEAGVDRRLAGHVTLAVTARTESREVDSIPSVGPSVREGSLEILPISLLLEVRPVMGHRLVPYFGAGTTLTVTWEKSGALDSLEIGPYLGLAAQAGLDFILSPAALLNLDVRWHRYRPSLESREARLARLDIDPLTLGIGVGFRF
jgi:outer membrane protein W